MRRTFVAINVLLMLAVLGACSNQIVSGKPKASQSVSNKTDPGKSKDAGTSPSSTAKVAPAKSEGPGRLSPGPTASMPTDVPGMQQAPLEVSMKFLCVKPGTTQSMTVRTNPGFKLSYATAWPDGAGHMEWAGAYGNVDSFPPSGELVFSWAVPPNAPTGQARTDVAVAGKINGQDAARFAHPLWKIASSC